MYNINTSNTSNFALSSIIQLPSLTMAEPIVSALLDQLASIMVQEIGEEVRLVTGVSKEVKKLGNNLRAIQAVLNDAEQRHVKEKEVRRWLDQLKDASYDMEDVLDEWSTARMKLQIEGAGGNALVPQKTVCSFFTSPCFGFKQFSLRRDIAQKIKDINVKLDDISKQKQMFKFHKNKSNSIEKPAERVESTSLIDDSEISGRDYEKNTLVSKLLCESSEGEKGLHIISLVGMGGIGKTTLAQLAYNNNEVINNFNNRIWVCVSDPFDEFSVAKAILEGLKGQATNLVKLESLIQTIRESIEGKKFLLVLDDVWEENFSKWEPFYHCLKNGVHGSRILITTRKETVAQTMVSNDIISVSLLSEDECWSLFTTFAFFGRSDEESKKLEAIGRKIVGKCKGLPLAAKCVGSLLRFKKTRIEWQNILDSEMWKLEEIEKGLIAPLMLSYYDLPSKVRRCFSYCAVFSKDYNIEKDQLIYLWMAQGYLGVEQKEEMEIIGQKYFDILSTRSFFQEFKKDDYDVITRCKMHDIIHDFAQFLRNNECFTLEINGREESAMNSFQEKVHHSMIILNVADSFPLSICRVKRMRTLLIRFRYTDFSSFNIVLSKLFVELTCLRALGIIEDYFSRELTQEIPMEIGKLIHLRYLNLHKGRMQTLPETLCELYNLQTLDISWCLHLKELPQGMGKLINLRHLVNNETGNLIYMPKGMERLTCLRTLKEFVVGKGVDGSKAWSLESPKYFNLFGELKIRRLGNVSDVGEAMRLQLKNMKNILQLYLEFSYVKEGVEDELLLEVLQPHPNFESLELFGYEGNIISPNWLLSLTNLRILRLCGCENCEHLPPLGKLPSLEILIIRAMRSLKKVGNEFLGIESSSSSIISFPKLKSLRFLGMNNWEEWEYEIERKGEIMPRLSILTIHACDKLKALPNHLLRTSTLQTLDIAFCDILSERYRKGTAEDWQKISHIPIIKIKS